MRTPLQDNQEISVAERALTLWGDTVYRVALGQTGSRAEAEDIYQDVFLKLLDQPRAFDSDDHLKAWLIRVTINQARDYLRARTRHATNSLEDHREEAERLLAQSDSRVRRPQATFSCLFGTPSAFFPKTSAPLSISSMSKNSALKKLRAS